MPIGFRVVNKTASSLRLEWHPPQKSTIHGEFLGYRLRYRKNMNNADLLPEREITVSDPEGKVSRDYFLFYFICWLSGAMKVIEN